MRIWLWLLGLSTVVLNAQLFERSESASIASDTGHYRGCAWADCDDDGRPDLFLSAAVHWISSVYYRNAGKGSFEAVEFGSRDGATGAAWGDFNNDGFPDLVRTYLGIVPGISVQVNRGSEVDITPFWGSVVASQPAAADFDRDGRLDFAVSAGTNSQEQLVVYRNRGALDFESIPLHSLSNSFLAYSPVWGDYNNDGWLDLFAATSRGGGTFNSLYLNEGGVLVPVSGGGVSSEPGHSRGALWGDYDNDGFLDLFVANLDGVNNLLYHNLRNGTFEKITNSVVGQEGGHSSNAAWADYDNDGHLDLFVANAGQEDYLYHNNGDGSFSKIIAPELAHQSINSLSCAWADYDNDGFVDLFVVNSNGGAIAGIPLAHNSLFRNFGNRNAWVKVRLVGVLSNRSAIGAKIRVQSTILGHSFWQLREISGGNGSSQNELTASFGLGDAAVVNRVRIEWPSGILQELENVSGRTTLVVVEPAAAITAPRLVDGQIAFTAISAPNTIQEIQSSPDLLRWTSVSLRSNLTGRVDYALPAAETGSTWYRAKIVAQ